MIKQFDRNEMELELNAISWNGINSVLASFLLELLMKLMDKMMLRLHFVFLMVTSGQFKSQGSYLLGF